MWGWIRRASVRKAGRVLPALMLCPSLALAASLEIAPPDEALSFARYAGPDGPRVMVVTAYADEAVQGVDLSGAGQGLDDPLALFHALGYAGVREQLTEAARPVSVPAEALLLPLRLGARHIAAGTNYPAHADESQVEDGPFLFPKLVAPTPPRSEVAVADRLLDYEVELCFVSLADIQPGQLPQGWGLILCNDFTDRASLLRHINPADVTSGEGFTTGKSFPGALPVGDLFVIPQEPRGFAAALNLRLHRGDELRQQSAVNRALWDIDEIMRQAWARAGWRWEYDATQVGLLAEDGRLPARSLVLSGTPDGTIFAGISNGQKLRGLLRWLAGGWGRPLTSRVIETYIDDARRDGPFLRAGERVSIRVARMGSIVTHVVP